LIWLNSCIKMMLQLHEVHVMNRHQPGLLVLLSPMSGPRSILIIQVWRASQALLRSGEVHEHSLKTAESMILNHTLRILFVLVQAKTCRICAHAFLAFCLWRSDKGPIRPNFSLSLIAHRQSSQLDSHTGTQPGRGNPAQKQGSITVCLKRWLLVTYPNTCDLPKYLQTSVTHKATQMLRNPSDPQSYPDACESW
jgi:hypothetical protein